LISETGQAAQAMRIDGQCGKLIKLRREKKGLSKKDFSEKLGVTEEDVTSIENGKTPLEIYAPLLLKFAEIIEQPIFNLFYPCGLPLAELGDYP
jgi:transcriptional regulator with XRE-family HTH domain